MSPRKHGPWRVALDGTGYRIDQRAMGNGWLGLRLVRGGVVRLHACGRTDAHAWAHLAMGAAQYVRDGQVAEGDGRLDPVEEE